jgi:hypothetical protein
VSNNLRPDISLFKKLAIFQYQREDVLVSGGIGLCTFNFAIKEVDENHAPAALTPKK